MSRYAVPTHQQYNIEQQSTRQMCYSGRCWEVKSSALCREREGGLGQLRLVTATKPFLDIITSLGEIEFPIATRLALQLRQTRSSQSSYLHHSKMLLYYRSLLQEPTAAVEDASDAL